MGKDKLRRRKSNYEYDGPSGGGSSSSPSTSPFAPYFWPALGGVGLLGGGLATVAALKHFGQWDRTKNYINNIPGVAPVTGALGEAIPKVWNATTGAAKSGYNIVKDYTPNAIKSIGTSIANNVSALGNKMGEYNKNGSYLDTLETGVNWLGNQVDKGKNIWNKGVGILNNFTGDPDAPGATGPGATEFRGQATPNPAAPATVPIPGQINATKAPTVAQAQGGNVPRYDWGGVKNAMSSYARDNQYGLKGDLPWAIAGGVGAGIGGAVLSRDELLAKILGGSALGLGGIGLGLNTAHAIADIRARYKRLQELQQANPDVMGLEGSKIAGAPTPPVEATSDVMQEAEGGSVPRYGYGGAGLEMGLGAAGAGLGGYFLNDALTNDNQSRKRKLIKGIAGGIGAAGGATLAGFGAKDAYDTYQENAQNPDTGQAMEQAIEEKKAELIAQGVPPEKLEGVDLGTLNQMTQLLMGRASSGGLDERSMNVAPPETPEGAENIPLPGEEGTITRNSQDEAVSDTVRQMLASGATQEDIRAAIGGVVQDTHALKSQLADGGIVQRYAMGGTAVPAYGPGGWLMNRASNAAKRGWRWFRGQTPIATPGGTTTSAPAQNLSTPAVQAQQAQQSQQAQASSYAGVQGNRTGYGPLDYVKEGYKMMATPGMPQTLAGAARGYADYYFGEDPQRANPYRGEGEAAYNPKNILGNTGQALGRALPALVGAGLGMPMGALGAVGLGALGYRALGNPMGNLGGAIGSGIGSAINTIPSAAKAVGSGIASGAGALGSGIGNAASWIGNKFSRSGNTPPPPPTPGSAQVQPTVNNTVPQGKSFGQSLSDGWNRFKGSVGNAFSRTPQPAQPTAQDQFFGNNGGKGVGLFSSSTNSNTTPYGPQPAPEGHLMSTFNQDSSMADTFSRGTTRGKDDSVIPFNTSALTTNPATPMYNSQYTANPTYLSTDKQGNSYTTDSTFKYALRNPNMSTYGIAQNNPPGQTVPMDTPNERQPVGGQGDYTQPLGQPIGTKSNPNTPRFNSWVKGGNNIGTLYPNASGDTQPALGSPQNHRPSVYGNTTYNTQPEGGNLNTLDTGFKSSPEATQYTPLIGSAPLNYNTDYTGNAYGGNVPRYGYGGENDVRRQTNDASRMLMGALGGGALGAFGGRYYADRQLMKQLQDNRFDITKSNQLSNAGADWFGPTVGFGLPAALAGGLLAH